MTLQRWLKKCFAQQWDHGLVGKSPWLRLEHLQTVIKCVKYQNQWMQWMHEDNTPQKQHIQPMKRTILWNWVPDCKNRRRCWQLVETIEPPNIPRPDITLYIYIYEYVICIYIYMCIYANYSNSQTWNVRPFWDDSNIVIIVMYSGYYQVFVYYS